MISSKISRKLRTGIVMGFMGWILVKMNDANLKIQEHAHEKLEKAHNATLTPI